MTGPRISRQYLRDETLDRAVKVMLAQTTVLGTFGYRYRDHPDLYEELRKDEDALGNVLSVLLNEQRQRRHDDREAAL